jgi:hypothetical protein
VSLLGAIQPLKKQQKLDTNRPPPDFLYAITRKNDDAKIENCIQVSAAILSQSREIFMNKIYVILKNTDPHQMEICYTGMSLFFKKIFDYELHNYFSDTDSILMATNGPEFKDCLKNDLTESEKSSVLYDLFGDSYSSSNSTQPPHYAGKLLIEGVHTLGYFRNIISYYLEDDDNKKHVRMKGVPRFIQSKLSPSIFTQNIFDNSLNIRSTALRVTPGNEIIMVKESRSLPCSLNLRKCMHVSDHHIIPLYTCSFFLLILSPDMTILCFTFLLQDPIHAETL